MDYYANQLQAVHEELMQVEKYTSDDLKQMPKGHLLYHQQDGHGYYRQAMKTKGGYSRIGINHNPDLIAQLAQKEYLERMHEAAEKNVQLLHKLEAQYQSMDPAVIIAGMDRAARSLPEQLVMGGRTRIQDINRDQARAERMEQNWIWANEDYEQSKHKPEEKIHLTSPGFYVRSKSEALITEKLYDYYVPNRYEQVIWIGNKSFAPDFTFRDAGGKLFFWEHAGMMGDPNYVRKHQYKMGEYERAGIVPWKNLIVTYDTEDGAINMALIDSIVKYQVLSRM